MADCNIASLVLTPNGPQVAVFCVRNTGVGHLVCRLICKMLRAKPSDLGVRCRTRPILPTSYRVLRLLSSGASIAFH